MWKARFDLLDYVENISNLEIDWSIAIFTKDSKVSSILVKYST